jgi:hypothetical protein
MSSIYSQLTKILNKADNANSTAAYRAMNRAVSKTQTQYKRRIATLSGLKASQVAPRFYTKKATKKSLTAFVSFATKFGIPLDQFKPKEKTVRIGKRKYKGVTVKLPIEGRVIVKGGFLATVKSGKSLVLMRKGAARYPTVKPTYKLYELAKGEQKSLKQLMSQEFETQFKSQLEYELSKIK